MEKVPGLSGKTAQELDTLLGIISAYPSVRSIILFGSTAKGVRNADSDIDLLVLVESNGAHEPIDSARIWRDSFGKISFPLDVIVETMKDFEERKPFPTLERKIAREGKVLYAA
ncbi:MAG: nucleotidyltransferase domain-containing protein [Rectinemataceae bacterium]